VTTRGDGLSRGRLRAVRSTGYPRCPYCGAAVLTAGSPCVSCVSAAKHDPLWIAARLKPGRWWRWRPSRGATTREA